MAAVYVNYNSDIRSCPPIAVWGHAFRSEYKAPPVAGDKDPHKVSLDLGHLYMVFLSIASAAGPGMKRGCTKI